MKPLIIFPLVRVQISPMRFSYVWSDIPTTEERSDEILLLMRYTHLLTAPLPLLVCQRLQDHFALHQRFPGWSRDLFKLAAEGRLEFDDTP